tara:strand:+ start:15 stop:200 length:186 start_codon:yes stop_codon:yes gene_type:complete
MEATIKGATSMKPTRETNPLIITLLTQLVMNGYSDEQILSVLTDKIRPLTVERIAAFREVK